MSLGLFDVLGPIMHGPSSSHTAGPNRIAYLACQLMGGRPDRVELGFHHAYMASFRGQGSHTGMLAGCLGYREYDPESARALALAREAGLEWTAAPISEDDQSRNTMRLTAQRGGRRYVVNGVSVGGGSILIDRINGLSVHLTGGEVVYLLTAKDSETLHTAVAILSDTLGGDLIDCAQDNEPHGEALACITARNKLSALPVALESLVSQNQLSCRMIPPLYTFRDCGAPPLVASYAQALELLGTSGDLSELAIRYECRRSGVTPEQVLDQGRRLNAVVCQSLQTAERELPDLIAGLADPADGQHVLEFARSGNTTVGPTFTTALARAMLLAQLNAAAQRIVACPTGGAAGTLPAALLTAAERYGRDDEAAARAFLAAALVGVIIGSRASFSGTVGGCQSEIGIGTSMAAAAVVYLAGGTGAQSIQAAVLATKNLLGLTCDPPVPVTEVPCIKRNAMGTAVAFFASDLALAGVTSAVAPDDVLSSLVESQQRMPTCLKFGGGGGMAATPSAEKMEQAWQEQLKTLE